MVKRQKKHNAKKRMKQGQNEGHSDPAKGNPNTRCEYCSEPLFRSVRFQRWRNS